MATHEQKKSAKTESQATFVMRACQGLRKPERLLYRSIRLDMDSRLHALIDSDFSRALGVAENALKQYDVPSREEAQHALGIARFFVRELRLHINHTKTSVSGLKFDTSYVDIDMESPLAKARDEIAETLKDSHPEYVERLRNMQTLIALFSVWKKDPEYLPPELTQALLACHALESVRLTIEDHWPHRKEHNDLRGR